MNQVSAQATVKGFTHADTLRGSNTAERSWWDIIHYDITVEPDFATKTISGICRIQYKTLQQNHPDSLQLDLQEPMQIDSILIKDQATSFRREGNAFHVKMFPSIRNDTGSLFIYFHGKPRQAVRPPWDGGWIWKTDREGNPWMTVACQGLGASVWYPCKDIQSDEPDNGAMLRIIVPDSLSGIGNGRLVETRKMGAGKTMYCWKVINPINNYCIIPYIGKYVHFGEVYAGEKGKLDMDYWVLAYNLDKAKAQFTEAPRMMKAFEYWFGPYPFYEDGYKLVETPHLGMEHQGAIAYGNQFKNGYLGRDLSSSGWGMKWDFIIVHESGHEWFANNITTNDIADMWVHESFTNYSETLFTDYYFGHDAGNEYVIGTRSSISNDIPIIGRYGVNNEGSGDMYYKGGNMLHYIRQVISDDEKFRMILKGLNQQFYHKTVNSKDIEQYISKKSGHDFSSLFNQYLRSVKIPLLEYRFIKNRLSYRWKKESLVTGFNMPVKVIVGTTQVWLKPGIKWKTMKTPVIQDEQLFSIDKNFYIRSEKVIE
jgi:aminopeptidase N